MDQSRIIPEYIFLFDLLFRIPLHPFAHPSRGYCEESFAFQGLGFLVEHDDSADALAAGKRREAIIDLIQPDAVRDQLVQLELAF